MGLGILDSLATELLVRLDTGAGDDGVSEELVEFLILLETEEDISGDDSVLLVLSDDHDGDLEDFSDEVLEDGGQVDGGTEADSLSVSAVLEETGDSSDGEAQAGSGGLRDLLVSGGFTFCFSFSCNHLLISTRAVVYILRVTPNPPKQPIDSKIHDLQANEVRSVAEEEAGRALGLEHVLEGEASQGRLWHVRAWRGEADLGFSRAILDFEFGLCWPLNLKESF